MTLDNHNQTTSSEDEIIELSDEQEFQSVTGACSDCGNVAASSFQKANALRQIPHPAAAALAESFRVLGKQAARCDDGALKSCGAYPRHAEAYNSLATEQRALVSRFVM